MERFNKIFFTLTVPSDICDQLFSHIKNLKRHMTKVHNIHNTEDVSNINEENIVEVRQQNKEYGCMFCHKVFTKSGYLSIHIITVHEGRKGYKCAPCNKQFYQLTNLKVHQKRVHSDQKEYTCTFCNKEFLVKIERDVHKIAGYVKIPAYRQLGGLLSSPYFNILIMELY